ncbi:MAG: hypothetical protein GTN45_01370 [Xanthomonadales bacterium]|nr:hypothetical protein [Xanthomonadales bacterium]
MRIVAQACEWHGGLEAENAGKTRTALDGVAAFVGVRSFIAFAAIVFDVDTVLQVHRHGLAGFHIAVPGLQGLGVANDSDDEQQYSHCKSGLLPIT